MRKKDTLWYSFNLKKSQLRDILNYQAEDNVDEDDLINQLLDEGLKVLAGKLQEHHRIFARLAPLPEDTERLK